METIITKVNIQTQHELQFINITDKVKEVVETSGVLNGVVFILTLHTTTAITVNECLPDIERDLSDLVQKLVPDDKVYYHARFLPTDGQMAVNAPSHLRSALLGFQVFFPIQDGKILTGARQTVYFIELDGPQFRSYVIQVIGNKV